MIRVAASRDCERFAALHAESFSDNWSEAALLSLLDGPGVFALAADGGFIMVRAVQGEAEILTFAVAPGARRTGVGRALITAAIDVLRKQGVQRLYLEVSEANRPALRLYQESGFVERGRRPKYYADGADALTLVLEVT